MRSGQRYFPGGPQEFESGSWWEECRSWSRPDHLRPSGRPPLPTSVYSRCTFVLGVLPSVASSFSKF